METESSASTHTGRIIPEYSPRALGYDSSRGGWHADLASDFVAWLSPREGDAVLDLACGTGLVTLPMSSRIGKQGIVIGIDLTPAMLSLAREKYAALSAQDRANRAPVSWIEGDITSTTILDQAQSLLDSHRVATLNQPVKRVSQQNTPAKFDIITLCSAYVLLPSASNSTHLALWARYLKPGGRIIIDIPTEGRKLMEVAHRDLRTAIGLPVQFSHSWIQDSHALERLMEDAGLQVLETKRTKSYLGEATYGEDEMDSWLDEQRELLQSLQREGPEKVAEARRKWDSVWRGAEGLQRVRGDDGKMRVVNGWWLYVTIGQKPT